MKEKIYELLNSKSFEDVILAISLWKSWNIEDLKQNIYTIQTNLHDQDFRLIVDLEERGKFYLTGITFTSVVFIEQHWKDKNLKYTEI